MPSTQRTIIIDRPIDEVFAFFADISNDPKWRGDDIKEVALEGGPMGKGARIRQRIAVAPFGPTVQADMQVAVYDPPTELVFEVISGPMRPHVRYAFAPAGTGTEVSFSIDAPLTGVKQAVMGAMAEKRMHAEAAALDNAKRVLES